VEAAAEAAGEVGLAALAQPVRDMQVELVRAINPLLLALAAAVVPEP